MEQVYTPSNTIIITPRNELTAGRAGGQEGGREGTTIIIVSKTQLLTTKEDIIEEILTAEYEFKIARRFFIAVAAISTSSSSAVASNDGHYRSAGAVFHHRSSAAICNTMPRHEAELIIQPRSSSFFLPPKQTNKQNDIDPLIHLTTKTNISHSRRIIKAWSSGAPHIKFSKRSIHPSIIFFPTFCRRFQNDR